MLMFCLQMRMEGFKKLGGEDLERVIEKDDSNSSVTTDSDEGKHLPKTCRETLCHGLQTTKFQIAVVCLVIFNCLLVITELLIDLRIFELQETSTAPTILHFISIGILGIFLVEIGLKVFCMRLDFFKRKMEVFDGAVVVLAFSLSIAFANKEGLLSAVGLLIVLRLWRVTRILNGEYLTFLNLKNNL